MERRRVVDDDRYAHFVTFSVDRRRRLLDHDHPRRIVLGVLNDQLNRQSGMCAGFVIMPDHVHAIVWFPQRNQLTLFMHEWKRRTSRTIREWYDHTDAKYFQAFTPGDRFWQPKYYSFSIHSQEKLEEKLAYMHNNPVRAGLATHASDWRWSSARWYIHRKSVGVPISWPD